MTNAMGGANLHTPQSIFQHMMGPPNVPQQGAWMQMPQVPPLSMPWSVPALQQPELIRFTGEPSYGATLHQKRKLEAPDLIETRQTKQFITEEKMAAHFKDLRISSTYQPQSPVASTSKAGIDTVFPKSVMDLDLDSKASADGEQHPRLVLSEEIKSIPQEPIIPLSLLSKLERPTMALVLWEPPSKHLRLLPTLRETSTPIPSVSDDNNNNDANDNNNNNNNSDDNNNNNNNTSYINNNNNNITVGNHNNNNNTINNNNNEAMPDLNQALVNNSSRTVFEPMEL